MEKRQRWRLCPPLSDGGGGRPARQRLSAAIQRDYAPLAPPPAHTRRICSLLENAIAIQSGCVLLHWSWLISAPAEYARMGSRPLSIGWLIVLRSHMRACGKKRACGGAVQQRGTLRVGLHASGNQERPRGHSNAPGCRRLPSRYDSWSAAPTQGSLPRPGSEGARAAATEAASQHICLPLVVKQKQAGSEARLCSAHLMPLQLRDGERRKPNI